MARADVEALRGRFAHLREELVKYPGTQVNELPEELRKKLQALPVIPSFTSGGLEAVETAIRILALAEAIIDDVIAKKASQNA